MCMPMTPLGMLCRVAICAKMCECDVGCIYVQIYVCMYMYIYMYVYVYIYV